MCDWKPIFQKNKLTNIFCLPVPPCIKKTFRNENEIILLRRLRKMASVERCSTSFSAGVEMFPLLVVNFEDRRQVKDSKMLRLELRWHSGAKICHRRMACKEGFQYLSLKM